MSMTIFSGRTVKVPGSPTSSAAARPASTLEVPTNPATNGLAGRS